MSTNPQWLGPGVDFMCEICFGCHPASNAAEDENGVLWDVCKGECARQAGVKERNSGGSSP